MPFTVLSPAAAGVSGCAQSAVDSVSALAMAKRCGARVEALDQRTETGQIFVNPDGTAVAEEHAYPQRVRRNDGTWAGLDATLIRNTDGSVSPRSSVVNIVLSGGGAGVFASASRSGHRLDLSWPDTLPAPVLDGNTATYRNVYPDVDLVVNVSETGFNQVLIVKNRQAARHPAVRSLRLGVALTGLRWDDKAGLRAVDGDGRVIMASDSGRMWESAPTTAKPAKYGATLAEEGETRRESSPRGPGSGARDAAVNVTRQGSTLAITPDTSLLDDPRAVYPLFVDPGPNYTKWTMINSQYHTTKYWNFDKTDCPPEPGKGGAVYQTECGKVGRAVGYSMIYRSMWEFSTAGYPGKQVLSAKFTIDLLHSSVCDNYTWTQLRWVNGYLDSETTWDSIAGAWDGIDAGASNVSSCSQARKGTEYAGGRLNEVLQAAANSSWGYTTWGLKAEDESNSNDWKKFDAKTATLIVVLNTPPNTPDQLSVDNQACASGANRPFIKTATPTLRSHVWDEDGDRQDDWFAYAQLKYTDRPLAGDINADGKADAMFWRPATGDWTAKATGSSATTTTQWGLNGDIPLTGDFGGDGRDDLVVWRPSSGEWYVAHTGGSAGQLRVWGVNGDIPLVGDFNGDNVDDAMIFRPSTAEWYLAYTNGGAGFFKLYGDVNSQDVPLVADYNGDNKDDIIIYRPSTGDWWLAYTDGAMVRERVGFGGAGDRPFIGDFNADNKDDFVIWRAATTAWDVWYSGGSTAQLSANLGDGSHEGVIGDFNADNKDDIAVFNGGAWTVRYTGGTNATLATGLGGTGQAFADIGSGVKSGVDNNAFGDLTTIPLWHNSIYTFRSQANDYPSRGVVYGNYGTSAVTNMPGNCEWQVDLVKPAVPTVTSDIYVEGQTKGSVGKTGRFTFASSADTTSYRWGWSDPPGNALTPGSLGGTVSIDWTPQSGGLKTLYVTAVDRAGNEQTKSFQFYVSAPTNALARWRMNDVPADPPASTETLIDDTNPVSGKPLTLHGGGLLQQPGPIVGGQPVLDLDGVDDYAARAATLDTSKSFTVSAWVKMDTAGVDRTIISQAGTNFSSFYLGYDQATQKWSLRAPSSPNTSPAPVWEAAVSTGPAQLGVWTHLTGVYDSAERRLYLYVNGVLEGVSNQISLWNATGEFRIGRSANTWFDGSIAVAQVWDRAITSDEARVLTNPDDATWGSKVGLWHFDAGYDPSADSSNYGHDLNYRNSATIPLGESGKFGTGLQVGPDGYMETDAQVLHTDQSFTVSAWVKMNPGTALTSNYQAVTQSGVAKSGFWLGSRHYGGGTAKWTFSIPESDTDTSALVNAASSVALTAADQGVWTKLTGSYDANSRQLKLYVNDVLMGSAVKQTPAWDATGTFLVGRALWSEQGSAPVLVDGWPGNIDEVVAYQGVFTPNLALGKPVTADSACNATETAAKAVDGRWASTGDKWCSVGASKWLQIDLGTARPFREITIRHADQGGESTTANTKDFTIAVSDDGSAWTTIATVTGNTRGLTDHAFAAVTKRYIRLSVQTPTQNSDPVTRIYEVEVY
ncbi:LamG-like jellyroll fold domain-containing protein [Rhizocola hellebori]|uniref:LamG-like jellyroll fold domain-containing protein n=1 Tax=Rhizocola hellebori TaxID=1392758 RepID=UPI0019457A61|nr:LamG-like jellyroll fold domain-containing protein [Rhizocola hellebori]